MNSCPPCRSSFLPGANPIPKGEGIERAIGNRNQVENFLRECHFLIGKMVEGALYFAIERMNVETKYLRMIQGMKRKGQKDWTVYILLCGDGSFYTGIAKDVWARVKQHCEGRGANYTRTHLPIKLIYQQPGLTRSQALIREAQIKAMTRSKKEEILFSQHCA